MKPKKGLLKWILYLSLLNSPSLPLIFHSSVASISTLSSKINSDAECDIILDEEKKKLGVKGNIALRIYEYNELRRIGIEGGFIAYTGLSPEGEG